MMVELNPVLSIVFISMELSFTKSYVGPSLFKTIIYIPILEKKPNVVDLD